MKTKRKLELILGIGILAAPLVWTILLIWLLKNPITNEGYAILLLIMSPIIYWGYGIELGVFSAYLKIYLMIIKRTMRLFT